MKSYIGIDLGGTHVRTAVVKEDGMITCIRKQKSEVHQGPKKTFTRIVEMVESMPHYETCEAIGIGVPGVIDHQKGCLRVSDNLPGFAGYPFVETLKQHFQKEVYVENDVNCAGLAEALFGAGQGKDIVYYISLSTGVGGVLIDHGNIYRGAHGFGGELSKIWLSTELSTMDDPLHLRPHNNMISGTSLVQYVQREWGISLRGAEELFSSRQEKAQALIHRFCMDLALLFNHIAYLLDPDVIVLGGGLMASSSSFLAQADRYFHALLLEEMQSIQVKKAFLQEPGIVGAALLAQNKKTA